MKRNWKTLRAVLEAVEDDRIDAAVSEAEEKDRLAESAGEKSRHEDEFFGHMLLAVDAGLVEGFEVVTVPPSEWGYRAGYVRLTMSGHDLLDSLRSEKVFKKALALASFAHLRGGAGGACGWSDGAGGMDWCVGMGIV